jgi:DNA-binding beta-propeller fold protein YncE
MTRLYLILPLAILSGISALAQVPEINFDSAEPLKLPEKVNFGETAGVATDSKGNVFVYTRTGHPTVTFGTARPFAHGGSKLYEFDKTGKFVREIGKDSYGFLVAQQVRVDPQDNIWVVDQMSSMVIKFDPNGRVQLLLGRKSESERVPAAPLTSVLTPRGGQPGEGVKADIFERPTDVAWDAAGNIYVADGYSNARVAKFDKDGKFIKSWGSRGTGQGQFNTLLGIAVDKQGNVYVADSGNKRIQVFDGDGNFRTEIQNIGSPAAICITPGAHQYLYASNSNTTEDLDNGEIYKIDLDGKVVGKFGRAGKLPKEFDITNALDCRSENDLYVGELGNWRVQKLTLHAK